MSQYAIGWDSSDRGHGAESPAPGRNLTMIRNRPANTQDSKSLADLRSLACAVSGNARLTCLFASFAFLQFTVLGLANHAGEGFLTTGQRELVYYVLQVFVILGFLLHAVFAHFCVNTEEKSGIRKWITYTIYGLFLACMAVMLLTGTDSLFYVIVSVMASLCLGGIGGSVHLRMSLETLTGADVAKCMGIGSAVSVALQYLLQIRWGISPLLPLFMLGSLLLMIFTKPAKDPGNAAVEAGKAEKTTSRQILLSILITVVFVLFACFYNEYIHHLQIQSDYGAYNVYSWPRLLLVPGYLLFAAIGDRKKGKYVPLASLCIMLIALLNVVLVQSPGMHWLNMCLFYFAIAASTSYYLLTFWHLAPGTQHPALWAPFGRIIDSAMVLIAGAIHLSLLPAPLILGMDIAGVALIILLMAVSGSLNLGELTERQSTESTEEIASIPVRDTAAVSGSLLAQNTQEMPVSSRFLPEEDDRMQISSENLSEEASGKQISSENLSEEASGRQISPDILSEKVPGKQISSDTLSEEELLDRMRQRYDLTRRETDVLRELVLTEDKQTVISERLSIKVKTLQDYVTRLYRKTGATTRAGLIVLYHENQNQE